MINAIKTWYKQFCCTHQWPKEFDEDLNKKCSFPIYCVKCNKKAWYNNHDYQEIKKYIETETQRGISYSYQHNYVIQIFECSKCNHIKSEKTFIS